METQALAESGCLEADGENGVLVRIHVQPRAAKNGFVGLHGGAVKLRITAPPVDGKANSQISELLAKLFQVPKSAVTLASGQQSREKRFRVTGISRAVALQTLAAAI